MRSSDGDYQEEAEEDSEEPKSINLICGFQKHRSKFEQNGQHGKQKIKAQSHRVMRESPNLSNPTQCLYKCINFSMDCECRTTLTLGLIESEAGVHF